MSPRLQQAAKHFAEQLNLEVGDLPRPGAWTQTGLTIGAIALRMNALSMRQIDEIVDSQAHGHRLFGEIGVELGILRRDQVERLLELQALHQVLELGELLFMEGKISQGAILALTASFFEPDPGSSEA